MHAAPLPAVVVSFLFFLRRVQAVGRCGMWASQEGVAHCRSGSWGVVTFYYVNMLDLKINTTSHWIREFLPSACKSLVVVVCVFDLINE